MFLKSKQPNEKIPIGIDFVDVLPDGESIVLASSTIVVLDSLSADVTSTIRDSGPTVTGTTLNGVFKAGTHNQTYLITFTAQTTNGYKFEEEVKLRVREKTVTVA